MKMLAHQAALAGLAVDQSGNYMISSGQDRKLRSVIWECDRFQSMGCTNLQAAPRLLAAPRSFHDRPQPEDGRRCRRWKHGAGRAEPFCSETVVKRPFRAISRKPEV